MSLGIVLILGGFIVFLFAFIMLVLDDYAYRIEWNELFNRFIYKKVPARESNKVWVCIIISVVMFYIGYMLGGLSYVNFD
jgi:hypothetical protein